MINPATVTRDNYAYYGADEGECATWMEDPQQGIAKGKVREVAAGTVVDVLGDPVTTDKFLTVIQEDMPGIGTIQNQYDQPVQAMVPISLPTASGKWWLPLVTTTVSDADLSQESGNGDSNADGTGSSQTNQPGSQGPGGTDQNGGPLGGNAGTSNGLSTGTWGILLALVAIAITVYYGEKRNG